MSGKQSLPNLQHIQIDGPTMPFDEWLLELVKLHAKEDNISINYALSRINKEQAYEWWQDGFTPYGCFREDRN